MFTYKQLRKYDVTTLKNMLEVEYKGLEKNKQEDLWWRIERSNKTIDKIKKVIEEKENR